MDVWDGSNWRTILVGGYNAGARGFYALDITNPNNPIGLWEFCSDDKLCPIADADLGYSFGNPIITKRGGKWVVLVSSGYNNVNPGSGRGFLFVLDAIRGTVLEKVALGEATPARPLGFVRISAWADNFMVDNTVRFVVGGDQEGNLWKIDLTGPAARVLRLAQALDANGKPQPITTRPELGLIDGKHRVVFVGTGRYLGVSDLTDPATQKPPLDSAWQQSIYAFKDLDTPLGSLRSDANKLVKQSIIELAGGTQRSASRTPVDWSTQNGWYLDLNPNNLSPGERVSVDPQLVLGTLLVVTNVPGASACSVGGDSWIYQLDYRTGSWVAGSPIDLVARKQTGALTVGLVIYQLQKGAVVGQIQRSEATMRRAEIVIAPSATPSRRISWREITPGMQ
jgi:type IV pilus assembly protein PilY1